MLIWTPLKVPRLWGLPWPRLMVKKGMLLSLQYLTWAYS
jgi:hypothetical protein